MNNTLREAYSSCFEKRREYTWKNNTKLVERMCMLCLTSMLNSFGEHNWPFQIVIHRSTSLRPVEVGCYNS